MAATGGRPVTDQFSSTANAADDIEEGATTEPVGPSGLEAHEPRASAKAPSGPPGSEDAPHASHNRLRTLPPRAGELSETTTFRETLVAARRFGATLNGLLSAVDVFARGVEGARAANDALLKRLDGMKEHVNGAEQRVHSLEAEVQELRAELARREAAFAAERQFLTDEQDEFLRALLEEHEEELQNAKQDPTSSKTPAKPSDVEAQQATDTVQSLREKVDNLRAERERARELVQRMRSQRDGAQAELKRRREVVVDDSAPKTLPPSGMAHPTTPAPPPFAQVSRTPAESSDSMLSNLGVVRLPRLSPPPAELAGVLHGAGISRSAASVSHATSGTSSSAVPRPSLRKPGATTIGGMPAARSAGPQAPVPVGYGELDTSDSKLVSSKPARPSGSHSPTNPSPPSFVPRTSLGPNAALGTKGTLLGATSLVPAGLNPPGIGPSDLGATPLPPGVGLAPAALGEPAPAEPSPEKD